MALKWYLIYKFFSCILLSGLGVVGSVPVSGPGRPGFDSRNKWSSGIAARARKQNSGAKKNGAMEFGNRLPDSAREGKPKKKKKKKNGAAEKTTARKNRNKKKGKPCPGFPGHLGGSWGGSENSNLA